MPPFVAQSSPTRGVSSSGPLCLCSVGVGGPLFGLATGGRGGRDGGREEIKGLLCWSWVSVVSEAFVVSEFASSGVIWILFSFSRDAQNKLCMSFEMGKMGGQRAELYIAFGK